MAKNRTSSDKTRVTLAIDNDLMEKIDALADAFDIPRAQVLYVLITQGLGSVNMFSFLGLTPQNIKRIQAVCERLGIDYHEQSKIMEEGK